MHRQRLGARIHAGFEDAGFMALRRRCGGRSDAASEMSQRRG